MKSTSRLPKNLKWMFAILEVLVLTGALGLCVIVLVCPMTGANVQWELPPVSLLPESGGLTVRSDPGVPEVISIRDLQGTVRVQNPVGTGGVLALFKRCGLPLVLAYLGFFALLFDFLRRLFRNVARGDTFTQRNIRLLHQIGVAILAFTLISAGSQAWYSHEIAAYLNRHAAVEGIRLTFGPPASNAVVVNSHQLGFQFSWTGIWAGLLVLALGEVFRQGLALKQENDLTI